MFSNYFLGRKIKKILSIKFSLKEMTLALLALKDYIGKNKINAGNKVTCSGD